MGASDLTLRTSATPFVAQIMGYNRGEQSDQDVTKALDLGDLKNLANASGTPVQQDNYIRILLPHYGQIVACFLTMGVQFDPTEAYSDCIFRLSIHHVNSDTDFGITALTVAQIAASHRLIQGNDLPFQGIPGQNDAVYRLNLMPAMVQPGSANYRQDMFVIGVHFSKVPVTTNYKLRQFRVDMSGNIAGGIHGRKR